MTPPESVTLPLGCSHCGGNVQVEHADWAADAEPSPQPWTCPYCRQVNTLKIAGRIGPAVARYASGTKDLKH